MSRRALLRSTMRDSDGIDRWRWQVEGEAAVETTVPEYRHDFEESGTFGVTHWAQDRKGLWGEPVLVAVEVEVPTDPDEPPPPPEPGPDVTVADIRVVPTEITRRPGGKAESDLFYIYSDGSEAWRQQSGAEWPITPEGVAEVWRGRFTATAPGEAVCRTEYKPPKTPTAQHPDIRLPAKRVLVHVVGGYVEPDGDGVFRAPERIDRSGKQDVAHDLSRWLNMIPPGTPERRSRVLFPRDARYRCEDTVYVAELQHVEIDGNGALLFSDTNYYRARRHFIMERCGGVEMYGLHIRGSNTPWKRKFVAAWYGQHGLRIGGCVDMNVHDCSVTDVWGDLLNVGRSGTTPSKNVVLDRMHLNGCGRQGMVVGGAEHVYLRDSYMGDVSRSGLDFEPTSEGGWVREIHIEDCEFGYVHNNIIAARGGEAGAPADYIYFERNRSTRRALRVDADTPWQDRDKGYRRNHWYIRDNDFVGDLSPRDAPITGQDPAIRLIDYEECVITGNRVAIQTPRTGTTMFVGTYRKHGTSPGNHTVENNTVLRGGALGGRSGVGDVVEWRDIESPPR